MTSRPHARRRGAFTLVELLVVIGIIAVLVSIFLPAMASARGSANTVKCLANLRSMESAHLMYMNDNSRWMIRSGLPHSAGGGGGGHDASASWLNTLQRYYQSKLAHRCPSDTSPYWDSPVPGTSPPAYRSTSFAVNNYVDPGHAPPGVGPYIRLSQIPRPATTVHFVELAEVGNFARSDNVHVENWYIPGVPDSPPPLAGKSLALNRHGGKPASWDGRANYGFLDGHAETLPFRAVFTDPARNRFDPKAQP